MKLSIATICILGLIGMVVGVAVQAGDTVTATVTPKLITVTVTDGSVDYGILGVSITKNTALYNVSTNPNGMDTAQTQTAANGSNVPVTLNIKSSDAVGGTTWELAAAAGENVFVHKFSTTTPASWTQLPVDNNSYATLAGKPAASSVAFDLQITTPTVTTGYGERTITVTVQVTE